MQTTTQHDYLKANAENVWFVLGAYFFAFFPWGVMSNIDFVSEKWRTCSRTRKLAHIHLASYTIPIVYVAVYAEAQRRHNDNKELGAALAALLFNIYQVLRTLLGLVQLNAFVAWCKDAVECIRALNGDYIGCKISSSESTEGGLRDNTRRIMEVVGWCRKEIPSWCKRVWQRMRTLVWREEENADLRKNGDRENIESSVNVNVGGNDGGGGKEDVGPSPGTNGENRNGEAEAEAEADVDENGQSVARVTEGSDSEKESNAESKVSPINADGRNWIEDHIMVNNMVVDNELGGREVTVLPSWEKTWRGLKNWRLTPSKWLRTDQVMLNTVRWGGAYLSGMGKGWSVDREYDLVRSKSGEILKSFFSREMDGVRSILQAVEWVVKVENDDREFLAIYPIGSDDVVELAEERCTAYGSRLTRYDVEDTYTVDPFSFEFDSLVSSYPSTGEMYRTENRERVGVGLVHSVLLAKYQGVEKLQAIRRYYDEYRLPEGGCLRNAFKLLLKQTDRDVSDDAMIWRMFDSEYDIPLFPYRMQMVALWDGATNWRVLQASALLDNFNSLRIAHYFEAENENEAWVLHNALPVHPANIFDDCAKWTNEQIDRTNEEYKASLGVVMETVRTFLADWVTASAQKANWEPEIPAASAELKTGDIPKFENLEDYRSLAKHVWLTWFCQRELLRKVAKMWREDENFTGNAALIMLFILGFPLLKVENLQETSADGQGNQDSADEAGGVLSSNPHQTINMNTDVWRASTPLAPQDISLEIQIDKNNRTACVRLQNDSGDGRFKWQYWVDAAMGCMKGFEKGMEGKRGYGREIVRGELQKPMVEMCPLRIDGHGIEKKVVRTRTARVWMGWPVFDVLICKFEVEQWLEAVDVDIRKETADREVGRVEGVINQVISNLLPEKTKRNG